MIIAIEINIRPNHRRVTPVVAPLGAAAYAVVCEPSENPTTVSIIFAMMCEGDTQGIQTLNRVMKTYPGYVWVAVSARPEEQQCSSYGPSAFTAYQFNVVGESILPANEVTSQYMQAITALQSLPKVAPAALNFTMPNENSTSAS